VNADRRAGVFGAGKVSGMGVRRNVDGAALTPLAEVVKESHGRNSTEPAGRAARLARVTPTLGGEVASSTR
jgi:hypothetical protein